MRKEVKVILILTVRIGDSSFLSCFFPVSDINWNEREGYFFKQDFKSRDEQKDGTRRDEWKKLETLSCKSIRWEHDWRCTDAETMAAFGRNIWGKPSGLLKGSYD